MQKPFYLIAAITCALLLTAERKATGKHHRYSLVYKYIGAYPVSTASQVTNVYNWTLVANLPTCSSLYQACSVSTTIPYTLTATVLAIRKIPSSKIPSVQTVTGIHPRFTASPNSSQGIISVYSQSNQPG